MRDLVVAGAKRLVWILAMIGVAAYAAAALATVADVIGRHFGLPIIGVVDIVQLCIFTGAWLVMPLAFLTAAHVGVDFVVDSLPRSLSLTLRAVAMAVSLILIAAMLWTGFQTFLVRRMFGDVSQQLGIPVMWFWYPLLIGLAASILGALAEFDNRLRGKESDHV